MLLGEYIEKNITSSLGNLNKEKMKNEIFFEENSFFQDFEILEAPKNEINKNPIRFAKSYYLTSEEYSKMKENKTFKDFNENINIIKLITSQDFVNGCWKENEYTTVIKKTYIRAFNILKDEFNKNLNNYKELLFTFIVLYYLEKEKAEILDDLEYSIYKAKNYFSKYNSSYDIIKSRIKTIMSNN